MEGYLSQLLAVSAVVTVCSLFAYKSGRAGKIALSVLLVYTALSPLSAVSDGLFELPLDGDSADIGSFDKTYEQTAESAFCEGTRAFICSELGIDSRGVRVSCSGFDFKKMRAESVRVILSGEAAFADRLKIKKLVEDNVLSLCEVEIEIG